MKKQKKGFTLIELIAVLVILAIIALIVTPLVMNIVKKAKDSANKRSVDAYGKAVELGVATYLLDNGDYPTDISSLTIEYSGNEVVCNTQTLNEDGSIYLSECSVKGTEVKDSSTEDGWYHYGKSSNKEVTYQAYNVGDVVTYNGMNFYVIEASDEKNDRVTMLKAEPLTVDEVNTYGIDENGINHVNRYASSSVGTANDSNGYGGMLYYSSATCGYPNGPVDSGCISDYNQSEVKYVVDAWAADKLNELDMIEDTLGYKARLLNLEDLTNNLGYLLSEESSPESYMPSEITPSWVYNDNYYYWTMISLPIGTYNQDIDKYVYVIGNSSTWIGSVADTNGNGLGVVRPVITLLKSSI